MSNKFIGNMLLVSFALIVVQIFLEPIFWSEIDNPVIAEVWITLTGFLMFFFGVIAGLRLRNEDTKSK